MRNSEHTARVMPRGVDLDRIAFAGLMSFAVAMGIGRFAFTPLLPVMQEEGLLDVAAGGTLASVHFAGYLIGALLGSRLPSSPTISWRTCLIIIAAATFAMGMTENFLAWALSRFAAGVCSAFTLVLVGTHCIRLLAAVGRSDLQGRVFSGVGAGIGVVGLGELALLASQIPSALSWLIFGALSLLGIAVVWNALDIRATEAGPADAGGRTQISQAPLQWRVIIAYGAAGMGYIIPATFLPVMARDIIDNPLIFGWGWPIFGTAAFVSTLLSGRLHETFSNRQIWTVSQFVMAVGLVMPALYPHMWVIVAAGICVGGTFMIITMAGIKETHRIVAGGNVQRHVAALTAAFATGQMIGPVFAGWIYDASGSFTFPLVMTSLALAVTAPSLHAYGGMRRAEG